jgi:SNF2 family DNA or RNA helicase
VDRVEVLEPRDKRLNRYRDSKGRVVLYDLEMKTHPSFSVNGFLVHNSSKMKDPTSQITKKLLEHSRQVALRWIMSGTPAPNSPLEYWAQITFIEPSLLGKSFYGFRNHFAHQVGYGGYTWIVDGEKLLKLQKIISQVSFSVSKDDCLDLPERIHSKRDVLLTEVQKKFYQEMKRTLTLEISEGMITAANAAVKCSKLRQISSGFIYDEDGEVTHRMEHRKINVLEEILDEIPATEPVIIWYNFNAEKEEILSCLTERKESVEIYGAENREAVDRFREGKTRIIIANPASLGHGITLTNCCYAIYYSLSYSLEQFHQSRDRIYRIGQTRKCQYFYIVAPGTIEVDILRALQKKQTIAEAVLGALK